MEGHSGVAPSQTESSRLQAVVDFLTSAGAAYAAVFYLLGFAVNSFYLAQFGIVNVELLRARYVVTGGVYFAFMFLLFDGASRGWDLGKALAAIAHRFRMWISAKRAARQGRSQAPVTGPSIGEHGEQKQNEPPDVLTTMAESAIKVCAILLTPYVVVLPAVLYGSKPRLLWDPGSFRSSLEYWPPRNPMHTIIEPFFYSWAVPFVVLLGIQLLLWVGITPLEWIVRSWSFVRSRFRRNSPAQNDFEAKRMRSLKQIKSRDIRTFFADAFSNSTRSKAGAIAVAVAALIVYSEHIYDRIPQQLGGGLPLTALTVKNSEGAAVAGLDVSTHEFALLTRAEGALVFRVRSLNNDDTTSTSATSVLEMDASSVQEIDYDGNAKSSIVGQFYAGRTALVLIYLNLATVDGKATTPLDPAAAMGIFCIITTRGTDASQEICDQQSEDVSNAQGIIQLREPLREGTTLGIKGAFHANGTSCTDFVAEHALTINGTSDETQRRTVTFAARPCFGFVATRLSPDGSTQLTLSADELTKLMTFCVDLKPKAAGSTSPSVQVCDNDAASDADPRPGYIVVKGLNAENYVANAMLKGACVLYSAPSATTIAPDPWTYYEAGMVFTPLTSCGEFAK